MDLDERGAAQGLEPLPPLLEPLLLLLLESPCDEPGLPSASLPVDIDGTVIGGTEPAVVTTVTPPSGAMMAVWPAFT